MPRAAPTSIIEHRISLQDAERAAVLPILHDVQQFTEQANFMRQVATYGALGLGAGALYILPKVWSLTAQAVAGILSEASDLKADLDKWTESPVKSLFKAINDEAVDFTQWAFGIDLPDWAKQ